MTPPWKARPHALELRDLRHLFGTLLAALAAALPACADIDSVAPLTEPALGEPEILVPFDSPPEGVVTQRSNNNLDIVQFEGRYFLAFRTAPNHFASDKTVMYVVSSEDQKDWQLETKIELGTD